MNDLFQKMKKPLVIVAIFLVCFIAYNYLKPSTPTGTLSSATGATGGAGTTSQSPGQSILPLLLKIKDVSFNAQFFNDPAFHSLVDYTQPIVPEDAGRDNPFAPTSATSASSSVESLGYVDQPITSDTSAPKTTSATSSLQAASKTTTTGSGAKTTAK